MSIGEGEGDFLQRAVLDFIRHGEGNFGGFGNLARAIHGFQFRENRPYQRFCRLRGVEENVADWTHIPAVPQQAFKASKLVTFPQVEARREFRTSGTTGEGFGSHYFRDLSLYEAAIEGGWQRLGLDDFSAHALTPSSAEAPHSSLSYMMNHLLRGEDKRFYLRAGKLEIARLSEALLRAEQPVLVMGTALAFFNLIEQSSRPLPLPPGSRLLETGGYKGSGRTLAKEDFYAQLGNFFVVPPDAIINEYGMTELSSQFYTQGLGKPHRSGKWLRQRVLHPLTQCEVEIGETGLLQLFDLANVGSVLAIQTEDLAVRAVDGFLLLGRDPAALARGCSRSADDLLNR